ncbi:MAG: acyltransferase family protein [Arthrobacter sp.]|uniref:acyltransferase family protein n=1 Tax=Arthrobacter sp. TaxID=1667 RepID=UPI003478F30A
MSQATTSRPSAPAKSSYQPEIQGLRALAVLLVVVYHFWPHRLTGGFVGVDIFFVISGYLITAHIYRDIVNNGRLDLGAFWARRIRRLLPLSFLVLGVTAIAAVAILPSTQWATTSRQIVASALYVENWVLAGDAVDYSAMDDAATAVQHFWSLSVEEQFYVVWPLFLFAVVWLAARRGAPTAGRLRRLMITFLLLIGAASLAYSLWFTAYDQAQAYFVTPTRIWEFAAGALAALVLQGRQFTGRAGNVLGWAGLAAVLASAVLYSSATPFPGYAAILPIAGTVALLVAGGRSPVSGVYWWFSLKPATVLGDLSYAVYLWHWPVVVLAPFVWLGAETAAGKLLLIAMIILLSWLSKIHIEDRYRRSQFLKPTRRSLAMAGTGMAAVAALAVALPWTVALATQGPTVSQDDDCYGYAALANPEACQPVAGSGAPSPSVAEVAEQSKDPLFPDCQAEFDTPGVRECLLGAPEETSDGAIAVFGDSHATAWLPALEPLAQRNNLTLKVYSRSGCTPTVADLENPGTGRDLEMNTLCTEANREIVKRVAADDSVGTVVVAANQADSDFVSSEGFTSDDPQIEGFTSPWRDWLDSGKRVVAMGEIPRLQTGDGPDAPTCLAEHARDPLACAVPESKAFPWGQNIRNAAETMDDEDFTFVETTDFFCRDGRCHAQIGGIVTYYDKSHVSHTYAANLSPVIEDSLRKAGAID